MRGRIVVLLWSAVAVLMCLFLACNGVQAESKGKKEKPGKKTEDKAHAKPEAVKATGTISVTKDEKGKVTDVKFTSDDGKSYTVFAGKAAAKFEKLDGKKVEVAGMAAEKDGEMLLKIGKCKEMKEDEQADKGGKEEKPEPKKKESKEKDEE